MKVTLLYNVKHHIVFVRISAVAVGLGAIANGPLESRMLNLVWRLIIHTHAQCYLQVTSELCDGARIWGWVLH